MRTEQRFFMAVGTSTGPNPWRVAACVAVACSLALAGIHYARVSSLQRDIDEFRNIEVESRVYRGAAQNALQSGLSQDWIRARLGPDEVHVVIASTGCAASFRLLRDLSSQEVDVLVFASSDQDTGLVEWLNSGGLHLAAAPETVGESILGVIGRQGSPIHLIYEDGILVRLTAGYRGSIP